MSRVVVVGLAGPSCSGKTTVALNLIKLFPHTVVIHQDDFYKPDSQIPLNDTAGVQDWDCPGSFDMEKLVADIESTRLRLEGIDGTDSVGDLRDHFASQWANPPEDVDKLIPTTVIDSMRHWIIEDLGIDSADQIPFCVVLVDGILLYHDDNDGVRHPQSALDIGLFIYASYETLKQRREARSAYATKEGVWADPPGYFDSIVWPNFVKYHSGMIKAHPCILADDAAAAPGGSNVSVCSSDVPAKDMLAECVGAIVSEWRRRMQ